MVTTVFGANPLDAMFTNTPSSRRCKTDDESGTTGNPADVQTIGAHVLMGLPCRLVPKTRLVIVAKVHIVRFIYPPWDFSFTG